jgi:oxygen-independent coproporphyrinogen-3 oxidase
MGVQTFHDDLLRFLGRRHTARQAIDAVQSCYEAGIHNISIDLMYGLPGQTPDVQRHDLETATSLNVQHISSYCLSYEEGSPLDRMRKENCIVPADDDICATMYDTMCNHLRKAGYEHYEISNFSLPGYHSRHNSAYWDGTPYLGIGAGAHSYNGTSRQWNPNNLDTYMQGIEYNAPQFEIEHLSKTDLYNEKIMLTLRTAKGLNLSTLPTQDRLLLLQSAQPLLNKGLLLLENNHLMIPEPQMFISDTLISSLFK